MEKTANRREFLAAMAGGAVAAGQSPEAVDLIIKGGHVIDPASNLSAVRDVAVSGGRIVRVSEILQERGARRVFDARGLIVTPGLIDIHVHVYDSVVGTSIDPDTASAARGVTTVVDAGSAGANTFEGFRKHIIDRARTRVYALLNISAIGFAWSNEYADMTFVDPDAAIRTIRRHPGVILGLKVRMTPNIPNGQDLEVLRRARRASDETGVPIMVHIGGGASPLERTLELLKAGDIVTHALHARTGQILDLEGRVLPQVIEAQRRGIIMDIGHGSGNLSFEVGERAARAGWFPDTISSDIHGANINGPVYDLPTTLSKFMHLGMSVDQVIRAATSNAARALKFPVELGQLKPGTDADIAIFRRERGSFEFTDSVRQKRTGSERLIPVATFRKGVQNPA